MGVGQIFKGCLGEDEDVGVGKMGWFRVFIIFVIWWTTNTIAATLDNSTHHQVRNCRYMVSIETTCTKGAGTSNHVSLRFGDANSNEVLVHHLNSDHLKRVDPSNPQVLDDSPRKPFQACMLDHFFVSGPCVESPICFLYLKLAGDDDWRPGLALVRVLDPPESHSGLDYNFYFRRYMPRRVWHGSDVCDPELTPFGLKYRRRIHGKNPQVLP